MNLSPPPPLRHQNKQTKQTKKQNVTQPSDYKNKQKYVVVTRAYIAVAPPPSPPPPKKQKA